MLGIKRKQVDDDWGLVDSSGTDTDSSDDEQESLQPANHSKRIKNDAQRTLTCLPHELLCEIFILSSNPHLPLVCRSMSHHLYHCTDSVKLAWLLYRHNNDIQAAFDAGVLFPFFSTRLVDRMDGLYTDTIPYKNKKMPPHLFSSETPTTDTNRMITLLLDRGASPDKPKGYPLIKSAQFGLLDKVKLLVRYGANPSLRNNMALRVCAARGNMEMVTYFLDHLGITPDSETLKACVHKKLWNMVQVLVDHGAVPDMNTVNLT